MSLYKKHVFVCENEREDTDLRGCCKGRGAGAFAGKLRQLCKEAGLQGKIRVNKAGCLDACSHGAVAVVYPEGVWYEGVTESDAEEVFREHIVGGSPVERLRFRSL